jgi:LysM repeat protein
MDNSFFHIDNALTTGINISIGNAGKTSSYHGLLNAEMNNLAYKLPNLLTLDYITKHTVMPLHTECVITPSPYNIGMFSGTSELPKKYTVEKGDTLIKINQTQTLGSTTVDQLKQWNGLKNDTIKPGQELLIYPVKNPPYTVQINLYYQDFIEKILHPDILDKIATAVQTQPTVQTPTQTIPQNNVVDRSKTTLLLPGVLPGPVRQEPGSYDCFFANLSWCDLYFGGNKNIEDFRTTFKSLFPKNEYGAVSSKTEMYKLAGSNFTGSSPISQADFINAIESGHPIITNGNYGGRNHSLIIKGLTFDKKGNISSYLIIDPDREAPIYSISTYDMTNNCILNIVITGKKK